MLLARVLLHLVLLAWGVRHEQIGLRSHRLMMLLLLLLRVRRVRWSILRWQVWVLLLLRAGIVHLRVLLQLRSRRIHSVLVMARRRGDGSRRVRLRGVV